MFLRTKFVRHSWKAMKDSLKKWGTCRDPNWIDFRSDTNVRVRADQELITTENIMQLKNYAK